mgnify:CR=1 FL=1
MGIASKLSSIAMAVAVSLIAGCGGGGGSTVEREEPTPVTPPPTTPPTGDGPTWEAGVFEPQSTFVARCETPRTGIDPFTGNAYPDTQGSALEEKLWLRSWTNDTYLWYDEVPDNDPDNFSVIEFFDQLKTTELTPSGTPKDNFHFSQPTDEYNELTQGGVSSGYGFSFEFVSSTSPRELLVRYTEPGSPAAVAGVPRGASLMRVNGIDFVNDNTQAGVDAINAALFPDEDGQTNSFEFMLNDGSTMSADITSASVALSPVQNVRVINTASARVGYFQFNRFIRAAQPGLISAFNQFVDQNVTELVIDLRYNGGGLLALASQVSYMVAGPSQTNNAFFERLQFNDKNPTTNPVTGGSLQPTPFYSTEIDYDANRLTETPLPSLSLTRIYVLTTENTCSASESVMNALRGIDVEVVQIGATTCGKPYGFYPTDNCGETYFTIQFQGVNNKGFGDYADGFMPTSSPNFAFELPGCTVADDFSADLGSTDEALLSAALEYSETGSCPAVNEAQSLTASDNIGTDGITPVENVGEERLAIKTPREQFESLILHNRINEPVMRDDK